MSDWIGAEAALERLGVRPQTLYAYVSRRRIRPTAPTADPRRRLYKASDIASLAERKARGRKAGDIARSAVAWGEPVLDSAIATVADGRLYYRGRDAVRLAEGETFEYVARLLRGGLGSPPDGPQRTPPGATAQARMFAALTGCALADPPTLGRPPEDLAAEGAKLIDLMAAAAAGDEARLADDEEAAGPIHERLGRAWRVRREDRHAIRRALILLADHELNASTFAARVAASTGASLAASLLAGLAALSGPRHGGMGERVAAYIADAERIGLAKTMRGLRANAPPPGFGHALYPDGDPRAEAMLSALDMPPSLARLSEAVREMSGLRPNVDFALAAMRQSLDLPPDAPFAIFAAARSAGWIAHALEQSASGTLIRPRARYVGPPPQA